jgi:Leucine-rich repeat (LRR) protein
MNKRILSMLVIFSLFLTLLTIKPVEANNRPVEITQDVDEYTPFRESEHFLFDIPSGRFRAHITPQQLGWYLSEMDKLYEAMADFVGGENAWLPRNTLQPGDKRKILMHESIFLFDSMTAHVGMTQINFGILSSIFVTDEIKKGNIWWIPVHELGHNFGLFPSFNREWTADFLKIYASIATGMPLSEHPSVIESVIISDNDGTLDSWYQLHYDWQAQTDIEKSSTNPSAPRGEIRYGSILTCAILNFVRDHSWEAISQVFGSYHDGSYPVHSQPKYGGTDEMIRFNEFIDRISYFGGVDFRSEYLDYEDWLEYIESIFPVFEPRRIEFNCICAEWGMHNWDIDAYVIHLSLSRANPPLSDECIKGIANMPFLQTLNLSNNNITDISFLVDLPNLRRIVLSSNQITDFSVLGELPNLQELWLYDNQIGDDALTGLTGFPSLRILYLDSNQISDFSPLSVLPSLGALGLSGNQIKELPAMSGFANLGYLGLDENEISDISQLSVLTNLTNLEIANNKITDVSVLRDFAIRVSASPSWSFLDIRGNSIPLAQINALKDILVCPIDDLGNFGYDITVCNGCCEIFCDDCWGSPCICPKPDFLYISKVGEDYIEITNPTSKAISTKGLYLSVNEACKHEGCKNCSEIKFCNWQMPAFIIGAGGSVRINASSNAANKGLKRARTNFDLLIGGNLRLTTVTGNVLSIYETA